MSSDTLPMTGKVVLITGGTGGIGKATATGLATMGARVGIAGRDPARTQAAAGDIRAASGKPKGFHPQAYQGQPITPSAA